MEFIEDDENKERLKEALGEDMDKINEVFEAACISMGQDIMPIDMINIERFANKIISLIEYRHMLAAYLEVIN